MSSNLCISIDTRSGDRKMAG